MHTICSHTSKQRVELLSMDLRQNIGTGRTQGMVLRLGCSALTIVNSPILVRMPFLPARSVQPLGSMAKMPTWMLANVTQLSRRKSACTSGTLRHVCILKDFALTSFFCHVTNQIWCASERLCVDVTLVSDSVDVSAPKSRKLPSQRAALPRPGRRPARRTRAPLVSRRMSAGCTRSTSSLTSCSTTAAVLSATSRLQVVTFTPVFSATLCFTSPAYGEHGVCERDQ